MNVYCYNDAILLLGTAVSLPVPPVGIKLCQRGLGIGKGVMSMGFGTLHGFRHRCGPGTCAPQQGDTTVRAWEGELGKT